ncbi:hypothetical protein GJS26_01875 [Pectobacterium carotovorum subsp. carotovorum]|nr:hypothetical protein [Pectobacterium carotovorum subsp. carotovorum]
MTYPLDFSRQIDHAIHAMLSHAGGFFDALAASIDAFAGGMETLTGWLTPWGLVILSVGIGLWRIGKGFALFALLATLYIIYSGYSEHASITLANTLFHFFQPAIRYSSGHLERTARGRWQHSAHAVGFYADHARLCLSDSRDDLVWAGSTTRYFRHHFILHAASRTSD